LKFCIGIGCGDANYDELHRIGLNGETPANAPISFWFPQYAVNVLTHWRTAGLWTIYLCNGVKIWTSVQVWVL